MKVQVIYGEHTEESQRCLSCRGQGKAQDGGNCWICLGAGSLALSQRTYTYEAPEDTKLWDVLVTPTPQQGGKRGTVVSLSSDYDGPCKQAYPLPTFPCKGCGATLTPADPRFFCLDCWGRTPAELREALDAAPGFKALPVVRAIADYLKVTS